MKHNACRKTEPVVVIRHGKPRAPIRPLTQADLPEIEWYQLTRRKLVRAWHNEKDSLYDYL